MNCTTAKNLLLDEVYGDLEAHDSAELATHLAGCESCREELAALQAFRADLVIPAIEIPPGLTDRIMAKVDDAVAKAPAVPQTVTALEPARSIRRSWLSHAGAWAMRPQTAMAAVFLLMVGSSAWLLREHSRGEDASASFEQEQGAPIAAPAASASPSDFDPEEARSAHGLVGAAAGKGAPMAAAPATPGAYAAEPEAAKSKASRAADGYEPSPPPPSAAPAPALAAKDEAFDDGDAVDKKSDLGGALAEEKAAPRGRAGGDFASAMDAYRAARWDDATAGFDTLARQGDKNGELWAARSVREGHGCRTALTRFDHLAGTALGTPAGNDATFEGAVCYRNLGQIEQSTQRFQRLLAYEGYAAKARAEIDNNHRILVARKEAQSGAAAGGGGAARPAAKAPAKPDQRAPAGPAALSTQPSE